MSIRTCLTTLIVTLALGISANAQQLPRLFDVTGVAEDDTLSLRENPRATAKKLAEIPYDARGLEAVQISESGDWARLSMGEISGWASLRFLAARPEITGRYLAQPLHCFGTEPFWSLQTDGAKSVQYTHQNAVPQTLELTSGVGELRLGAELADLSNESESATLSLTGGLCSDGMSDALYGLNIAVLYRGADGPAALQGCCSLNTP